MPSLDTNLVDVSPLSVWGDEENLSRRAYQAFDMDRSWRDEWKDYEHITYVYERTKHSPMQGDDDMPRFNMMRQMISDLIGVILPNIPDVMLVPTEDVDPRIPEFERDIRAEILQENVEVNNALVGKVLLDNGFRRQLHRAIHQAGVYGSGVLFRSSDYSYSPKSNHEVRKIVSLLKRGKLKRNEAEKLLRQAIRIKVEWIDTREVFWEAGRRNVVAEDVLRCSRVEWVDLNSLVFRNKDKEDAIRSGPWIWFDDDDRPDPDSDEQYEPKTVGLLTSWELVPINYSLPTGDVIEDYVLAKTVTAGQAVIEKEIITREGGKLKHEDGSFESRAGAVRLPFEPVYISESDDHPYGYSVVEQNELAEDAFNRIIAILMRYSDRSLQNGKVAILESATGEGDIQRIEYAMNDDDQNAIIIRGNTLHDEEPDIKKIIQPINGVVPQPPAMLMTFGNYLMSNFQRTSSTLDDVAISRARSAAGKRAQIAAGDRPLLMPIENIVHSVASIHEGVYEEIQALYGEKEQSVTVNASGGERKQVVLNQQVLEMVPKIGPDGDPVRNPEFMSEDNPFGVEFYPAYFDINSTQIPMRAVPEGFSGLPTGVEDKARILTMWEQMQWLKPATARRLGLPRMIRDIDDAEARKAQQLAQQAAQLQAVLGAGGPEEQLVDPDGLATPRQQAQLTKSLNDMGALPTNSNGQQGLDQGINPIDNATEHIAV